MTRLKKCEVCKEEKYNAYIRDGKVYYQKAGKRKQMITTGYSYCPSCDTMYDADDKVFSIQIEKVQKKIISDINNQFDELKLIETNQIEIDGRYIAVLNLVKEKMISIIIKGFEI